MTRLTYLRLYPFAFLLLFILPARAQQGAATGNLIEISASYYLPEIIRKSTLVIPTRDQFAWQQLEFIAFLHFGPNTFSRVEWGTGKEDPAIFNPTAFDAGQWISVIKDAGMKLAMLTAKHHDGFCLWPTTTSKQSVASPDWRNGQDVRFATSSKARYIRFTALSNVTDTQTISIAELGVITR